MASQSDPARKQLAEYYRNSIVEGRAVSLRWLADNSQQIVGISVSYDNIKFYSRNDGWLTYLADDLGTSPGLRDKKYLLDKARADLFDKEEWKDKAASAQSFLALAKGIPSAYTLLIESDIVDVHGYILDSLLKKWDMNLIPSTHKKTLIGVMLQLEKLLPGEVEVEAGGVSPDAMLLGDRAK